MAGIYINNSNAILLQGLHDESNMAFINTATVEVTIKDRNNVAIPGITWPKSMLYVTGTDGDYRAVLEDTIPFIAGAQYSAYIFANGGTNKIGRWKFTFTPQERVVNA